MNCDFGGKVRRKFRYKTGTFVTRMVPEIYVSEKMGSEKIKNNLKQSFKNHFEMQNYICN